MALALMPTYFQIGIWAPILLAAFRFLQGLSLGGEFGGGITLTGEFAPPARDALCGLVLPKLLRDPDHYLP
ncbi:hypothetical protein [Vulcanisaeta souniana]|uniref:hypothetical protein n=1 Tax=Vulcanisaeta souniana TaxID=164452 RepID=UPI001FB396BF|nr:hypothetical protein [Vulcanisaeta souniana]